MRTAFITFLECEARGNWTMTTDGGKVSKDYTFQDEGGEEHLVRHDGLKRAFVFKKRSIVTVAPMTVSFNNNDSTGEMSVDEDERAGREPRPRLRFT